jgi:hypothetical protein
VELAQHNTSAAEQRALTVFPFCSWFCSIYQPSRAAIHELDYALRFRLTCCAARRNKEQLAEGLHLIDFEQLKIENQSLNEKIEERNEELIKLRKKTTVTVQVGGCSMLWG